MPIQEELAEKLDENAIVLEGEEFNKAIVGYSNTGLLIYDYQKLLDVLTDDQGMEPEEAVEFCDYNILGLTGNGAGFIVLFK